MPSGPVLTWDGAGKTGRKAAGPGAEGPEGNRAGKGAGRGAEGPEVSLERCVLIGKTAGQSASGCKRGTCGGSEAGRACHVPEAARRSV